MSAATLHVPWSIKVLDEPICVLENSKTDRTCMSCRQHQHCEEGMMCVMQLGTSVTECLSHMQADPSSSTQGWHPPDYLTLQKPRSRCTSPFSLPDTASACTSPKHQCSCECCNLAFPHVSSREGFLSPFQTLGPRQCLSRRAPTPKGAGCQGMNYH